MKVVLISDTHSQHRKLTNMPDGDLLIHCGDFSDYGQLSVVEDFLLWMKNLDYEHKVFIAGNHDLSFERLPEFKNDIIDEYCSDSLIYLENEQVTLNINGEDWKLFGTPYTPLFAGWAFNMEEQNLSDHWHSAPLDDVDILISHGPAYGILDATLEGDLCGVQALRDVVEKFRPRLFCHGHIHEHRGLDERSIPGTIVANISNVNRDNLLIHEPVVLETSKEDLMPRKKIMYTIFTEDEGRADWVTDDKKKAQKYVDWWYEQSFGETEYSTLDEYKETGLAYVVDVEKR
jgi:Icc-related predicted phosphoesterase